MSKTDFPNRVAYKEEERLLLTKDKERESQTKNNETNINFTRYAKVNLKRDQMGENLNYQKIKLDVVEEKIALMDHSVKSVKDPIKVKNIMDATVNDQYVNRVGLGDKQLLKKINQSRSNSPITKIKSKKSNSGSAQKKFDLEWDKSTVTEGLRPQYPGYSLVNEKLQPPKKKDNSDKEYVKQDPQLVTKRDPVVVKQLSSRSKSPMSSTKKNSEKYDTSLDIFKDFKAKNKDYQYFQQDQEYLGKKNVAKVVEFDYKKTEQEDLEEEAQKQRGGSLQGNSIDRVEENLEEEPDFTEQGEDDIQDKIEIEDEILYDEDIEELHMNKDSDFNDRVKNFNGTINKSKPQNNQVNQNTTSLSLLDVNEIKKLPVSNHLKNQAISPKLSNVNEQFKKTTTKLDKFTEDGITRLNSFYRLNSKSVLQKKNNNLDYWQMKADHKIVFKVDDQYKILIEELLKAGWVKSTHTGIDGADFIYGKDAFNIKQYSLTRPDQYIGQFRDNLVTQPRGLLTSLPKQCKKFNKDISDYTFPIYKIHSLDTFYKFFTDQLLQQFLGVLQGSENDLSGNNYAKLSNSTGINFNYRQDIKWNVLNQALQFLKDYFLNGVPLDKLMTKMRFLVDHGQEAPLNDQTRDIVEKQLVNYFKKYDIKIKEMLGDQEEITEIGPQFEVKECDAFMKDLRVGGYQVFSLSKFNRQTKGANLYRMTQFNTGLQDEVDVLKQYQFYDNLNDIVEKMTKNNKQQIFDDDTIVIQKYMERPISFKGKLVKIRMICVITSYSPLTVQQFKTLIGYTNGQDFSKRYLNKQYDLMKIEDIYNKYRKGDMHEESLEIDDMVFTSKELVELFQSNKNPTVNSQFNNKFIRDSIQIVTNTIQAMFGYADTRKNTQEVDCWDFVVDEDGTTFLDNVQFSVDLHQIGEGSRKLDKFQKSFWKNFAMLFTEYEQEKLAKGEISQIGNFKLLLHKNFQVKDSQ